MINEETALGARVIERLSNERVIWLTTTGASGPQPAPVWFIYERGAGGERILVFSKTDARRVANIGANPRVALNLNCTVDGSDVHVIRGVARLAPEVPQAAEYAPYLSRYRDWILDGEQWGETAEGFAAQYSIPVEITDLTVWGW